MNKDLDYIFPDPPEGVDPRALDPERIPESVAIIMAVSYTHLDVYKRQG